MEATMLRGCVGLLALLGMGHGLAVAQSSLPPPAAPAILTGFDAPAGLPTQLPAPGDAGKPDPKQPAAPADAAAPKDQAAQPQASQSPQAACQNNPNQAPNQDMQKALRRTHCGPPELVWLGAGFLLWWTENTPAPGPLVTTGPPGTGGLLGLPTTRTLFGTNRTGYGTTPGIWVDMGTWLDNCHQWGLQLAGFLLERQAQGVTFASDAAGNPLLARPVIFNTTGNPAASVVISQPAMTPGSVAAVAGTAAKSGSIDITQNLQFAGWELNLLRNLNYTPGWSFQVLGGFRYLDLYENLNISQSSLFLQSEPATSGLPTAGTVQNIADRFTTRNQAYLGQVGADVAWTRGPFWVDLWGKVGMGPNHERVRILGSTTTMVPGGPTTIAQGGLLALPGTAVVPGGNFGTHTTNWFVVVPEVGANVGVNVGEHVRLSAGYSFLYINSVARPGTQVNRIVNPSLVPSLPAFGSSSGTGQPSVITKQDDFWVHGVRFTLELRF
jgi:hypothetical protein